MHPFSSTVGQLIENLRVRPAGPRRNMKGVVSLIQHYQRRPVAHFRDRWFRERHVGQRIARPLVEHTVRVMARNISGATFDLAAATLSVGVVKRRVP